MAAKPSQRKRPRFCKKCLKGFMAVGKQTHCGDCRNILEGQRKGAEGEA